jgi:hypothetical protein
MRRSLNGIDPSDCIPVGLNPTEQPDARPAPNQ